MPPARSRIEEAMRDAAAGFLFATPPAKAACSNSSVRERRALGGDAMGVLPADRGSR